MANKEHLDILKQGIKTWNQWREKNPEIEPNLTSANLIGMNLTEMDFRKVNLNGAWLDGAKLISAKLNEANLFDARFIGADLNKADLSGVKLTNKGTDFSRANLVEAKLRKATFIEVNLNMVNLIRADLRGANLKEVFLTNAQLVEADLENAKLTNCRVYGTSAWNLKGKPKEQLNLIITPPNEPTITVDDLEVAQFVYLLLNNQKIRDVVNTITTKAVLILGRFTPERKAILDAIREELRKQNYLPILFDFDVPSDRDITETVTLLARMARFIIADLSEPSSIPKELEAIVPTLAVPVQPLIEGATRPYSMFKDYWKYNWVLEVHRYQDLNDLLLSLEEKVITPAEAKVKELEKKRNEASL